MVTRQEFEVMKLLKVEEIESFTQLEESYESLSLWHIFNSKEELIDTFHLLQDKGILADFTFTLKGHSLLDEYKVDNAVILAAGGTEISAKSIYSLPKGLYHKNGEILIERLIRQLREAGITNITVVVGYKQELFFYLKCKCDIKLAVNPAPTKGNILSLYAAKDELNQTYVCNCDNYYEGNPFSLYEYVSYHATVYKEDSAGELCVDCERDGLITCIEPRKGAAECLYGHSYFNKNFSSRINALLEEEISIFRIDMLFWEEFANKHISELAIYIKHYENDYLYEFDSIQEIQNIDSLFVENVSEKVLNIICAALGCSSDQVKGIEITPKGLSNVLFTFKVNREKFIFRYPGDSSSEIVYRDREVVAQHLAAKSGVDGTYVYIDEEGCKISKFREECEDLKRIYFDNIEFMKRLAKKIRMFHDMSKGLNNYKRYYNNPIAEADRLMKAASHMKGDLFSRFKNERKNIIMLFAFAERDGIKKCMCHNDINADNCLLSGNTLEIIDWEFAGYNDPAYDFGRVISGYDFDSFHIDEILEAYFNRQATYLERLHWIAYVGIHSWYYYAWSLYKESINESSRDWMLYFFEMANKVIDYALPKYENFYREQELNGEPI